MKFGEVICHWFILHFLHIYYTLPNEEHIGYLRKQRAVLTNTVCSALGSRYKGLEEHTAWKINSHRGCGLLFTKKRIKFGSKEALQVQKVIPN